MTEPPTEEEQTMTDTPPTAPPTAPPEPPSWLEAIGRAAALLIKAEAMVTPGWTGRVEIADAWLRYANIHDTGDDGDVGQAGLIEYLCKLYLADAAARFSGRPVEIWLRDSGPSFVCSTLGWSTAQAIEWLTGDSEDRRHF